jgi:hypothetical protein
MSWVSGSGSPAIQVKLNSSPCRCTCLLQCWRNVPSALWNNLHITATNRWSYSWAKDHLQLYSISLMNACWSLTKPYFHLLNGRPSWVFCRSLKAHFVIKCKNFHPYCISYAELYKFTATFFPYFDAKTHTQFKRDLKKIVYCTYVYTTEIAYSVQRPGYRLENPAIVVWLLAGSWKLFLFQTVQTGFGGPTILTIIW